MNKLADFSVMLMCYNHEKYVDNAIRSFFGQEHSFTWELLICDNASTDGTKETIERYVVEYSDIIVPVYRNKNMGVIFNGQI